MKGAARYAFPAVVVALTLLCAAGLWRSVAVIRMHVPLDPNEGWNAYHAAAASAGRPLYPAPQSYFVNNYPPLSFYLVGALGSLIGDNIIAGRFVSLAALIAVGVALFGAARTMGCGKFEAAMAPLWFLAGLLLFTDYTAMDDPQMLAEAVSLAGFVLVLRAPRTPSRLAAGAFLFVLAFFIKHNVVALAGGTTVWLLIDERPSGVRLALYGLGGLLAGLLAFRIAYGGSLLAHLVTARSYAIADLWNGLLAWLHWSALPLTGLAALIATEGDDRSLRLVVITAVLAIAIGLAFLGGAGVDPNVLFDADLMLALAVSLSLERSKRRVPPALLAAVYAFPFFVAAAGNSDWREDWSHPLRDDAATAKRDIEFLESRQGPAICEMLSFCYWAHKPPAVDVFNVGQQFETGARDPRALAAQVLARRFAVIQFDPDSPYSLGEEVHDAMAKAYRLDHTDDFGAFYVPR